MKSNLNPTKIILRYAALKSQEKQSPTELEEMTMIEDQLHLTAEAIMEKATKLALGVPY